jgi:hypothetical protein
LEIAVFEAKINKNTELGQDYYRQKR